MAIFTEIGALSETELFDEFENAQNISVSIILEEEPPPEGEPHPHEPVITDYVVTPNRLPDEVMFNILDNRLNITATDLLGVFPIITIKYMNKDETYGEVFDFDDLPETTDEIYEFRKDPSSIIIYTLIVNGLDESALPISKTYTFTVRSNYSITRDILISEIQKRL